MPLPLLIGLAVVTGGVGIAKGIGAADTQSKANDINEKAQDIVDLAKEKMEFSRESSGASIKQLGECKVDILQGAVIKFINEFKKVKNIEFLIYKTSKKKRKTIRGIKRRNINCIIDC